LFSFFLQRNPGKKLVWGGVLTNHGLKSLFRLLLVSGCWALIPGTIPAQVHGKPYQQWTAKEAQGLLIESPWAQTRAGLLAVGRFDPPTAAVNTAVTVSLRSALPVRQALARLKQLKNKYDKKGNSDKAAIDEKNRPLLECPECADYYMVVMSPGPGSENDLPPYLQRALLAQIKLDVVIKNEKGETRELVKFVKPKFFQDEAAFFFPRLNSKGEPLISAANRTLTISFDPRIFSFKVAARLARFEFDVAKMIVNGQVVF
jgi:hypothetical protein